MKKTVKIVGILALALLTLSLAACSSSSDEEYNLIFGKGSEALLPTLGNAAYINRSLTGEEPATEAETPAAGSETPAGGGAAAPKDDYVDPTAGLDCAAP